VLGWVWRVVAVVVPVVCLVTMMADHLVFNAYSSGEGHLAAGDRRWLDPGVSAVPWWLRWPWQVFGHGHGIMFWFVVLFFVAVLVDGYRLGARPASSLGGQPMGPGLGGAVGRLWAPAARWAQVRAWRAGGSPARGVWVWAGLARWWAVVATAVLVTGWLVVRDVGELVAAHVRGAGEPARAAMRRGMVAATTARALRETAMDHAAGQVRPGRARVLAVLAGAGLVVVALGVAPWLASGAGPGLLHTDAGWLPGVLTQLSQYWNSLPIGKQIMVSLALGFMFALAMGPIGWGVAGVLTWGLSHGAGIVTFVKDPRAATDDYLANLTPVQLLADGLDAVLTFAPGNQTSPPALARWPVAWPTRPPSTRSVLWPPVAP